MTNFSLYRLYNIFAELMKMVVYADVLIVLNLLVDYFLLRLTSKLIKREPTLTRILCASAVSGISSLYIFLPQSAVAVEIAVRLLICAIVTLICFGFCNLKSYIRAYTVFFAVTFGYAGGMIALWYIAKPNGMVINNSVVYFNISPIYLIIFSVAGYFTVSLIRKLLSRNFELAKRCEIRFVACGRESTASGIIDTGNSLEDIFGNSEIVIADKKQFEKLFCGIDKEKLNTRYRGIPISTVSGSGMLDGYRCDKAYITYGEKKITLQKPILAISKEPLAEDVGAIINPRAIE